MQYAYRDRKAKRENLDLCGFKELMLVLELKVLHMQNLLTVWLNLRLS